MGFFALGPVAGLWVKGNLVRLRGFEPPTFASGVQRSIQLSYRRPITRYVKITGESCQERAASTAPLFSSARLSFTPLYPGYLITDRDEIP